MPLARSIFVAFAFSGEGFGKLPEDSSSSAKVSTSSIGFFPSSRTTGCFA